MQTMFHSRFTMIHITCYCNQLLVISRLDTAWPDTCRWFTLRWHHNGRDNISNHQPHDCLLNRLFRRRSKETSKLRVTGLCVGNSPGTGEFPIQMASNAKMFPFDDVIMVCFGPGHIKHHQWIYLTKLTSFFIVTSLKVDESLLHDIPSASDNIGKMNWKTAPNLTKRIVS